MNSESVTLEVPLDSLAAAHVAAPLATRLELCDDLPSEGWSPREALIREVRANSQVHIVAMIRPRFSDSPRALTVHSFLATDRVMDASRREIEYSAKAGANSVAIGLLTADGFIDLDACDALAKLARAAGLEVAFLRTFDLLIDRERGMRDITDLGMKRVITAGVLGWNAAAEPIANRVEVIARDVRNARAFAPRATAAVEVVSCGGVRAENAHEFLRVSPHLHASCRHLGSFSEVAVVSLAAQMASTHGSPAPS